jgi:hypothetical protein
VVPPTVVQGEPLTVGLVVLATVVQVAPLTMDPAVLPTVAQVARVTAALGALATLVPEEGEHAPQFVNNGSEAWKMIAGRAA